MTPMVFSIDRVNPHSSHHFSILFWSICNFFIINFRFGPVFQMELSSAYIAWFVLTSASREIVDLDQE